MNATMLVAIIGGIFTLAAVVVGHFFNRSRELRLENLKLKLDRYMDLLSGFAEFGSPVKSFDAHLRFTNAINTMNLIANEEILRAVNALVEYVQTHRGSDYSVEIQNGILRQIILAIRADLGQPARGLRDFEFRVLSPGIRPGTSVES